MRSKLILWVIVWGLAATAASPVRAAASSPAAAAEDLRSALFSAQRAILAGQDGRAWLAQAQQAYASGLQPALESQAPEAAARAAEGLAAMQQAVLSGDQAAFAAARSQTWTAVLAGAVTLVEDGVRSGDLETAQAWLAVREFRTATRFARPNADATRALRELGAGTMDSEIALQYVHADLLDAYQARLGEGLRDLEAADASGFTVRRAELAGLAQGYFALLAPAYAEQRGPAALQAATADYAALVQTAVQGDDILPALLSARAQLDGFRAAPLSPAEQARRAGQLLRYINLVAVEYGRGVSDGRVTLQFEIQEAITFQEAAQAAFADLQINLLELDAAAAGQAAALLAQIGGDLQAAYSGGQVVSPDALRANAQQLTENLEGVMPADWKQGSTAGDFDVIDSMLDQMENAVRQGDYAAAESSRLEAYAIMESGPEARLMALNPDLTLRVENLFWNGSAEGEGLGKLIGRQAPLQEVRSVRVALNGELAEGQQLLSTESSPASTLGNAAVIVFREGLEAVVILASLMGSLKAAEASKYRKPLWLGSGLALLGTVLTWTLAREVLQALARYGEKLEAVVSLVAIVVLLLITNWFFHKSYWDGWLANFHKRKSSILAGEAGLFLGLVSLGFTSVYREGFEVVLFLQALVLDAGSTVVLSGVAIGLLLTVLVGILTFRFQNRLPHKKMLVVTGVLIGGVLLIMMGKTVHVLQLVGWMPATLIAGLRFPTWAGLWFGLYPSWEGLLLQLAAAGFVIGSYYLAEGLRKRHRRAPSVKLHSPQAG